MHIYKTVDFIGENKSFNASVSAEARTMSMHSHEFFEIAYVMEGYGTHYVNGTSDFIKEGDFIFLSPGIEHCTVSLKDETIPRIRVCNCLFIPEYFEKARKSFLNTSLPCTANLRDILSSGTPFCLVLHDAQGLPIKSTVLAMKHEMDLWENSIAAIIDNHLSTFLLETGRIYDKKLSGNTVTERSDLLIQELISYIRANLDLPLTLDLLAKHVHFSPEYLSRYFKKHTGKTISAFITELRMEKAKELLCHTSYPVSEVGYLCGYSSISNFRKYFSKIVGVSPSAYRKNPMSVDGA